MNMDEKESHERLNHRVEQQRKLAQADIFQKVELVIGGVVEDTITAITIPGGAFYTYNNVTTFVSDEA